MMFGSLWIQEFTRCCLNIAWKPQGQPPQVGDIVLFRNEPIYKHKLSAARITDLHQRKNRDVFAVTIEYRREVGGRIISVDRHLCHLYPFMGIETAQPQEPISGLETDGATGTTAPGPNTFDVSDEFAE